MYMHVQIPNHTETYYVQTINMQFLHSRNGYSTNGARYDVRVSTVVYMKSSTKKVVSNGVQASQYNYIYTISMVTV